MSAFEFECAAGISTSTSTFGYSQANLSPLSPVYQTSSPLFVLQNLHLNDDLDSSPIFGKDYRLPSVDYTLPEYPNYSFSTSKKPSTKKTSPHSLFDNYYSDYSNTYITNYYSNNYYYERTYHYNKSVCDSKLESSILAIESSLDTENISLSNK